MLHMISSALAEGAKPDFQRLDTVSSHTSCFPRSPKLFTETKMKQGLGKHCAVIAVSISQRDEGNH